MNLRRQKSKCQQDCSFRSSGENPSLTLPASGKCRHSFSVQSLPLLSHGCLFYLKYPSQFSSAAQSWLTLCHPMDCSTTALPVNHQFPEFTQTHIHCIGDAIQLFHPLGPPSPPAFNLSQLGSFPMSQFFASGHVWMWELAYKESWVPKNWCFWTVVLEKILESPLDFMEIQPVHPKGNQS